MLPSPSNSHSILILDLYRLHTPQLEEWSPPRCGCPSPSTPSTGAGSSQALSLVLPFPYLAGIAKLSLLKITSLSGTQSPWNLISPGCSFFQSCMVTDFPNDVPEALQHPGMLSESLREYAVVFSLVLLWSDSRSAFPKPGIKGSSRGTYPNVVGKQRTPLYGQSAGPSCFSHFWASARPRQPRCICSLWFYQWCLVFVEGVWGLAFFFCISCFSHLAAKSSGVRNISHSSLVSQTHSADDCGHTRSSLLSTLARQLPAPCGHMAPAETQTWLPILRPEFPSYFGFSSGTLPAGCSPEESYPLHGFRLPSSHAALITRSASRDRSWWMEWGERAGRAEAMRKRWQWYDRRHRCPLPSLHEVAPVT